MTSPLPWPLSPQTGRGGWCPHLFADAHRLPRDGGDARRFRLGHLSTPSKIPLKTPQTKPSKDAPGSNRLQNLQTSPARLQTCHARLQTCDARLRFSHARLQTCHARLQTFDARLQTFDARLQPCHARLQTSHSRLQTCDARLRFSQRSLQTSHARLQTSRRSLRTADEKVQAPGRHTHRCSLLGTWGLRRFSPKPTNISPTALHQHPATLQRFSFII